MKVNELMERVGISEPGRAIAYIKDGLEEINTISETHITTQRLDLTKDQRFYELPYDVIKITDIRYKNQLNNRDEYQSIPRMVGEPATEDADGV